MSDNKTVVLPELTDDEIVKVLHSLGIDTYPSKYGFPELQVSATNVPAIRQIVAILIDSVSALTAQPDSEREALSFIYDTFKRDIEQGYVTKDKQFVIDVARPVLTNAQPAPVRDAIIEQCAKICDEQGKELECFERARYCADAIRALKTAQPADKLLGDKNA